MVDAGIYFVGDPKNLSFNDVPEDTYVIFYEGYNTPDVPDAQYIPFGEYREKYVDIHANLYIIVGLNRMITPSNRTDFVHEYLSTLSANTKKISIDTSPFIGEPWRLFFHYLFTNRNKFNMPHSYAVETEWKHWFYREVNDCILSPENLRLFIDSTYTDLDELQTEFYFEDASDEDHEWYLEVKKHIFGKYHTPKSLIGGILKLSNARFGITFDYNSYLNNETYRLPDLGIYRFMVEENLRRMRIYNTIIKRSEKLGDG